MWNKTSSLNMCSKALLLVISAPSGAGKTTLCQGLLQSDSQFSRVITCTTRLPRDGEQDGVDYFFLSKEAFNKKIQNGDFLEYANVYDNSYGTLKSEVFSKFEKGQDVLLNIDVQGAAAIREQAQADACLSQALVTVFLTTPTLEVLEKRLCGRAQDAPQIISKRVAAARQEMARWQEFDYLLTSTTREEDLVSLHAIVKAERMRRHRAKPPVW